MQLIFWLCPEFFISFLRTFWTIFECWKKMQCSQTNAFSRNRVESIMKIRTNISSKYMENFWPSLSLNRKMVQATIYFHKPCFFLTVIRFVVFYSFFSLTWRYRLWCNVKVTYWVTKSENRKIRMKDIKRRNIGIIYAEKHVNLGG